jgi:hypothetical protein
MRTNFLRFQNPGMHEPECARKVFVARLPGK